MLIVHVHVHVKPEAVDAFSVATLQNAQASLREAGVLRFDVVQRTDDPTRFVLVEVYRDEAAPLQHKETPHYAAWREAVEPMMAEPRSSQKFKALFPSTSGWATPSEDA
jgi:quinol monooxygenase YgiN